MLSQLGRRAALPLGIPFQAAQSRHCELQATIGEITDGAGRPLGLHAIEECFRGIDPRLALRYVPPAGLMSLREAWGRHHAAPGVPASLPIVTAGVTQGLAVCADLFCGPDTPLILGLPYWDNYDVTFGLRTGCPIWTYDFYEHGGSDARFNVAGLAAQLERVRGPAVVLLNFPNNPTGYSPGVEVEDLVRVLLAHPHPLVVITDDAYHGYVYEPDILVESLYDRLAPLADPQRLLVCRVDGATKELVFFGGRVGFLTFSASGAAADVLVEKATTLIRGVLSSGPAPSQAAVLAALNSPDLAAQTAAVLDELRGRYLALKVALLAAGLRASPFNSGCFALLPLPATLDAEAVRQRLIHEQSVGVIAVPSANALRVAFCSVSAATYPELTRRIAAVVGSTAPKL